MADAPINTMRAHEVFETIAEQYAHKDAVVCDGERLTYKELNARANRLAHYLIGLGVKREEYVALALPKSCDLIVAILGILKAGATYVPLGDNFLITKLREIMDDAGCVFAVGRRGHLDELWSQGERVVMLDDTLAMADSNPETAGSSRDLAYILYTSGSTGEPKGVQVEHAGVVRLVVGQEYMPFDSESNHFFMGPISFDLSTLGIYGPLLNGSTMVIVPELIPDARKLEELIRSENVKTGMVIFGLFASLLEARPEIFAPMSTVLVGGEAVSASVMRRAMELLPNTRFVNAYGPTEATVLSTTYQIEKIDDDAPATIPIGKPLVGMSHVVVDSELMAVRTGEMGELCMIGVGVARGYLNREKLNREKFPTLDFDGGRNERVYRTGDRVYELPDGNIVFDGRIDEQVKIRGYRIELGAIEASIEQLDAVHSAAVVVVGKGGSARLVACVVGVKGKEESILRYLKGRLTDYMIPDLVLHVDGFEVTANGKVDKRALVELIERVEQEQSRTEYCAPTNQTQRVLCSIWEELLDCGRVGIDDSFLDLGGHSLRAVIMCSRVRDQLDVDMAVSVVFAGPTVRELAEWIDDRDRSGKAIERIPVADRAGCLPISFHQERLWMLDKIHPGDSSYNISIRLVFKGDLDEQAIRGAWLALHQRHEILRTKINETEQVILGCDEIEPIFRWEECVDESELDSVQAREFGRVFDLEDVPLIRLCVYKLSEKKSVLAVSMHHVVSDAWSCEILRCELEELYLAIVEGRADRLDKLEVQYADFSVWQRDRAKTPEYAEKLAYWREKLSDVKAIDLPTDFSRTKELCNAGQRVQIDLSEMVVRRIRQMGSEHSVTTNTVLLSAFNVWLHRLVGAEDIVVGMPIANREQSSLEGLIGFFMETIALRVAVRGNDSFTNLLDRTSRELWAGVDRCDVAFQHQVEAIHGHAPAGRNPLFEVFFNYIALKVRGTGGECLDFDDQEVDNKTAKFDLTCYIFDDDEAMSVVFNYRESLFTEQTMERYLGQFLRVLESALNDPGGCVSGLDILPQSEAECWKDTRCNDMLGELPGGNILDAVERTARRCPGAVAVRSSYGDLGYSQMIQWSHGACIQLRENGVRPGDRVVVGLKDHREFAAAVLGVLRAGAIYVPVDLGWPSARVEQVVSLSSARIVLCDEGVFLGAAAVAPGEWSSCASECDDIQIQADDPAYMLFTSGSTGVPKGVVQSHRGVIEHNAVFADSMRLEASDRVLMLSSVAFDAAPMDMYSAWFRGASWCPFDLQRGSEKGLESFIRKHGITVFHAAPSVLRWFTGEGLDSDRLRTVRLVVIGGEPAFGADVERVRRVFPGCTEMINGLGLTESSVSLQYKDDLRNHVEICGALPIGRASKGVCVRLVDSSGEPTELFGEIEIESSRIALGYWDAEHQCIEPLGTMTEDGHSRLRTGDLAFMRSDGLLVHCGRVDRQIQVHGCRVEIGEVQLVLGAIDGVREAVVVALEDPGGGHSLCAYMVLDQGVIMAVRELRSKMGGLVPGYMVPSEWMVVKRIPRIGGGKVDTAGLRSMVGNDSDAHSEQECEPINEIARGIINVYEEILGCEHVHGESDFFLLGGTSLKAIRAFTLFRERYATTLPISVMFQSPTPNALAALMGNEHNDSQYDDLFIVMREGDKARPVYLLPGVGGHPLGFGAMLKHLDDERQYIGVQLPGVDGSGEMLEGMHELALYIVDRMELPAGARAPDMIGYSFGGGLAVEVAVQLQRRGHPAGDIILLDSHCMKGLGRKSVLGRIVEHIRSVMNGGEEGGLGYLLKKIKGAHRSTSNESRRESANPNIDLVIRHHFEVAIRYTPSGNYAGEVTLIRADQPEWLRFHHDDGVNGWSRWIQPERVKIQDIEGRHLDLFEPEFAPNLADCIRKARRE
ncbi:MAG: amino acid adenylation domain-containing protein [Phycisphaerales bacterium]|nr:amino acid adenylation domain-containing protein [Phycisphaerales bacterium]